MFLTTGHVVVSTLVKSRKFLAIFILLWLAAIGLGAWELYGYANTPGRLAAPPQTWPRGSILHPDMASPVILVFAHPQCSCSSATIGELAIIMARCRRKASAFVLFYAPASEGRNWAHSDLWRDARAIPGVEAIEDRDGGEARRFGASTSGQTLLYGASRELLFNGGITASRGHAGGSYGRDAVVSLLETGTALHRTTPVFGCSLFGEELSVK